MSKNPDKANNVKIARAKGRPMLTWVGKRPLTSVRAYPAQLVERFEVQTDAPLADIDWSDWPEQFPRGGLLFHGDNKDVLAYLLANGFRGKVKLIYIDPPFDSGADYVRKVQLRGAKGTTKIDGEEYTLGEQIQYTDIWANDNYLQFMYERLLMLKELLSDDGSIYLHCDWSKGHYLRSLLDEVFGAEHCQNEIVWKRTAARSDSKTFNHIHDLIYLYTKSDKYSFNQIKLPYEDWYIEKYFTYKESDGRRFATIDATQSGLRKGPSGETWRGFNPSEKGTHWKFAPKELDRLDSEDRIYWPEKEGGWPRLKRYLDEADGSAIQSIWSDIKAINSQAAERTAYPTQKPKTLVERLVLSSSDPGDIVLDAFSGSGTTAVVAQEHGRRWINADLNKGAIQTAANRLYEIIKAQARVKEEGKQQNLIEDGVTSEPSQLGFNVYRVNDYDLQIQHNEAVQLACEHIGVTRTRTDAYFDGTLGNRLVKIVPFNHPLTPLDLEALKQELRNRPDEERDIVLVCLGMELAARAAVEEHNRGRPINKIHVIELRTDQKYGGFIKHEPLTASVTVKRKGDRLHVKVNDVLSPTILQRLNMEQGVFRAQIDDWRAVVDCIMIDTDYDGEVFNVALSDIPARKQDLVEGSYVLPAPEKGATVAVKVIDMLGEEAVVTKQV